MNRNPRRALSDFDCRVLSGPLAGPWTRGRSRHLNLHQSLDLVHLRRLLLTNFLPSFRATIGLLATTAGAITIYQIPTPIIIIIVIAGTGAMFRPPVRSRSLLCTRHGTVRIQRSIVNVASTWIHLDHQLLAQSRPSPHAASHALNQASVAPCPPSHLLPVGHLPNNHPPPFSPPFPLCVASPTRMQSDLCVQNAKTNVATVVVNNTGASLTALPRAKPSLSRWPYCLLKYRTHRGSKHTRTMTDCPESTTTFPIECWLLDLIRRGCRRKARGGVNLGKRTMLACLPTARTMTTTASPTPYGRACRTFHSIQNRRASRRWLSKNSPHRPGIDPYHTTGRHAQPPRWHGGNMPTPTTVRLKV